MMVMSSSNFELELNTINISSFHISEEHIIANSELIDAIISNDLCTVCHILKVKKLALHLLMNSYLNVSAICKAASLGRNHIMKCLISNGANPSEKDLSDGSWLRQPIHFAASCGNVDCIKILLENKANVNDLDGDQRTPLYWAATYGHVEATAILIAFGAAVNTPQQDGFTPLHAASCLGHDAACETLMSHGADVNCADRDNWTSLHVAVCYGFPDVVKLLIKFGAQVDLETNDNETAFHIACTSGNVHIARMLFEAGANVSSVNVNGFSPFHQSVYSNNLEISKFLVSVNAELNTVNCYGISPFCLAYDRRCEDVLRLMIAAGCNFNGHESSQMTHYGISESSHMTQISHNLIELISHLARNPRPLKELCCFKIRSELGIVSSPNEILLPVPQAIIDYILLKHI